jgi:hypothetical protein
MTEYIVAVSESPRSPVGTHVDLPINTRMFVGTCQRPDGHIGDLTAIRWDLVCDACQTADGSVHLAKHDCPNAPEPEPWTPHPDQLNLLEGLTP